uniref:TPR_REGION domain-containing protein n=1 Tax=Parastrongyloides trichosuri TaxID=131310 RepID=A0A0N4ZRW1_PARTI
MFRQAFNKFTKLSAGLASVQVAAVALTDKELSKKPEWYQHAVRSLETAVKDLSKKGFIESKSVLTEAEDVFQRVLDVNNVEILWRYARLLTEKAELSHCAHEKKELLHEAKKIIKKALEIEPAAGISGLHKWAGIIFAKLGDLEKKCNDECVKKHLKRATEIDAKDQYALYLYGAHLYKLKEYKEAVEVLKKAESVKPGFSPANKYYLGAALKELGKKDEALKVLKEAVALTPKYAFEGKAKSEAKKILITKYKLSAEDVEVKDD